MADTRTPRFDYCPLCLSSMVIREGARYCTNEVCRNAPPAASPPAAQETGTTPDEFDRLITDYAKHASAWARNEGDAIKLFDAHQKLRAAISQLVEERDTARQEAPINDAQWSQSVREVLDLRSQLREAQTMAPPNCFGAHTMAGLLEDAALTQARLREAQQKIEELENAQ